MTCGLSPPPRLLIPKAVTPLSQAVVRSDAGEGSDGGRLADRLKYAAARGTPVVISPAQMNQQRDSGGGANQRVAAQQPEAELAHAILDYLSEYPQAMDTLEGISEWWVMRAQVRVELDALLRVLGQLTERGCLERSGPEENPQYQLKSRTWTGE